jgi:signal transduction histidine kinase
MRLPWVGNKPVGQSHFLPEMPGSEPAEFFEQQLAALKAIAHQQTENQAKADPQAQITALIHLNEMLQRAMADRTAQLEHALAYEAALKRVTDRVRDSLDEHQILEAAVQELAVVLNSNGCNASLYDLTEGTSTVRYEYASASPAYQGRVAKMTNAPQIYEQLLQGQYFQFCSLSPHPERGRSSMLACPIVDDQGVMGDLWLVNHKDYTFDDLEIRLVQQVANQCAIAIRQARLYQAAQAQVKMLERLNQLKDDFLSTVSHELRTPMTNMKMAIEMLAAVIEQTVNSRRSALKPGKNGSASPAQRLEHYLEILRRECSREISLINDLLDLQEMEQSGEELPSQSIELNSWLERLIEPFQARMEQRRQKLTLHLPQSPLCFSTHQSSLTRILAELVNNACKYTPADQEIAVSVMMIGEKLRFQVTNRGSEIPPTELKRIFEKFYRVPSSDPWGQAGTGLGLALVQGLVMRLGGTIAASSGAGRTTFTVDFMTGKNSAQLLA